MGAVLPGTSCGRHPVVSWERPHLGQGQHAVVGVFIQYLVTHSLRDTTEAVACDYTVRCSIIHYSVPSSVANASRALGECDEGRLHTRHTQEQGQRSEWCKAATRRYGHAHQIYR